jgi:threonine/homoserine/homoserine lactone efflux protein
MTGLPAFLLASFLIELTPGPNMAWLAAKSLSDGRRAALFAVAGVGTGLALLGCLAALGVSAFIMGSPALYQTLRYAGFAYLLWLAWDTWRSPGQGDGAAELGSFRSGLITNLLNPKAGLYYVVMMPRFIDPALSMPAGAQAAILVAGYVLVATGIHAAVVLLAAALRPWLMARDSMRTVRRALALSLVAVAVWFLLTM